MKVKQEEQIAQDKIFEYGALAYHEHTVYQVSLSCDNSTTHYDLCIVSSGHVLKNPRTSEDSEISGGRETSAWKKR